MVSPVRAVVTAFSWLTVVPVRAPDDAPDRSTGAAVMSAVPMVGIVLGIIAAAAGFALSSTSLPLPICGIIVVGVLVGATRGMHVDGLSDTADGLGCYGPPERVAEVMRGGPAGPFGVVTLIIVLGVEWSGFSALISQSRWYELGFAVAVARVGAVVGCRRGLGAAHRNGFGALVAGTQSTSIAVWSVVATTAAALTGFPSGTGGLDPVGYDAESAVRAMVVVWIVVGVAWAFTAHCARRMAGITGDVLGATIEICVAIAVVGLLV